ncbi:hypothetical protein ACFE04_014006 [Oxalis oulophora]
MENVLDGMKMRAEIDTRAPFRSVKEAVSLFGEKVLAAQVYSNSILINNNNKEERNEKVDPSKLGTVAAELEETKQSLQKAKEDSLMMEHYLSSLKEELDRTKQELQQIKRQDSRRLMPEDLKEINAAEFTKFVDANGYDDDNDEFQRKRYVTFANPPSLAQLIVPQCGTASVDHVLERHPSLRMTKKTKKKPLIPLIGGIFNFSRKKGNQEVSPSPLRGV